MREIRVTDADWRRCIHCGLCLEACPTYPLEGFEGDSPRGRILLLRSLAEKRLDLSGGLLDPIRRCLGCGSCEPACPSGVEYRKILAASREVLRHEMDAALSPAARLLKGVLIDRLLGSPASLRLLGLLVRWLRVTGLARILQESRIPREIGGVVESIVGLFPDRPQEATIAESLGLASDALPARRHGRSRARARPPTQREEGDAEAARPEIDLFRGCVAPILLPGVEPAAVRLLEAAGYRVRIPRGQGCCGALAWHYGDPNAARRLLRRNLRAFATGERPIVVTAAGCGAALREAEEWLGPDDPDRAAAGRFARRVRDLSEALDERASHLRWRPIGLTISHQDACHLKQVQGVTEAPRQLLRSIPSLELRETDEAPNCCGSAGIYSFLEPEIGARLARETLAAHARPGVSSLVTSNVGCLLHLRMRARQEGRKIGVLHIAELLEIALDDEPGRRSPTAGRCS